MPTTFEEKKISQSTITTNEARTIAKEAYIYGFPLVDNYRIQYSYFAEWRKTEQPVQSIFTPRIVGMIMILFGLISLLFAEVQHISAIRSLRKDYPQAKRSLSSILALLILMFGLALFLAALFRQ